MQQYFKIGKLAASTGLKGNLVLQHSLGKKTSLKGLEAIFLEDKKEVWLTVDDFNKFSAKSSPIALLGFSLIDVENDLGEIIEVIEQPHQILCTIMYKGNEAMVPVHEENLLKIDKKNRKVFVEVPEGLLDIYG
jgi:16S rRNA processing protein RimM